MVLSKENKRAVVLSLMVMGVYFLINAIWLLNLTAPSDPLQYVGPAILPQGGFPFWDRLVLWLWIRTFAHLPIPTEMIGGVATLFQTTLILGLGTWWLVRQFGNWAGVCFSFIFILSFMALSIATYTYPMQLMTLTLLVTVIAIRSVNDKYKYLLAGIGMRIAILCKVQAYSFAIFLLFAVLTQKNSYKSKIFDLIKIGIGATLGVGAVFLILIFLDGTGPTLKMITDFFTGEVSSGQFKGRALGAMPPIYKFLADPTCLMAFIGFFLPFIYKYKDSARDFAVVGISQTIGLIAVYLITKRGGPLIHNYSYDSFVFGALAFSAVLGKEFSNSHFARIIKEHNDKIEWLIVTLSFAFLLVLCVGSSGVAALFFKERLYYWGSFAIVSFLVGRFLFKSVVNKENYKYLIIFLIIVGWQYNFAKKGMEYALDKLEFSKPYHVLARYLMDYDNNKKIWVNVKVNRHEAEDGSFRAKQIYQFLYLKKELNEMPRISFGIKKPADFDVVITDSPEVIGEISGKAIQIPEKTAYVFDIKNQTATTVKY